MSKFETKLEWANGAEEFNALGLADAYREVQIAVDAFKAACAVVGCKTVTYKYGRWSMGYDKASVTKATPASPAIDPAMLAAFAAFMASQGVKVNAKAKSK